MSVKKRFVKDWKNELPSGVIGNTSDFGSGECRFESYGGNKLNLNKWQEVFFHQQE